MGSQFSHRRKHRQKSHSQSHAEGTVSPVLQGHPLVPTEKHQFIETNADLIALCNSVREEHAFAFDTEFIGEDSYYAHTCLIQIATKRGVTLIDPFSVDDLTPLYELICDPDIITIVHAGIQDFEPVIRLHNDSPKNIFDTQIAAGFVGLPWPLSLTKTIGTILNHTVGGHFTFSQWDARPLTKRQLHYAADDVRYLIAIHDDLQNKLRELDREQWLHSECQKFSNADTFEFNTRQVVKKICGTKVPKTRELKRIQALAVLRNSIAKEKNLPPKDVYPNECIWHLAKNLISNANQLSAIRGFPKHIAVQFGERIIQCLEDSESVDPVKLRKPQKIESEPKMRQELDGAWSLFNAFCVGQQLAPGLVSNRQSFTDWYLWLREGRDISASPLSHDWRATFLTDFSAMINDQGSLTFAFDNGLMVNKASL